MRCHLQVLILRTEELGLRIESRAGPHMLASEAHGEQSIYYISSKSHAVSAPVSKHSKSSEVLLLSESKCSADSKCRARVEETGQWFL